MFVSKICGLVMNIVNAQVKNHQKGFLRTALVESFRWVSGGGMVYPCVLKYLTLWKKLTWLTLKWTWIEDDIGFFTHGDFPACHASLLEVYTPNISGSRHEFTRRTKASHRKHRLDK